MWLLLQPGSLFRRWLPRLRPLHPLSGPSTVRDLSLSIRALGMHRPLVGIRYQTILFTSSLPERIRSGKWHGSLPAIAICPPSPSYPMRLRGSWNSSVAFRMLMPCGKAVQIWLENDQIHLAALT